jgi:hypothetical protein
VLPSSPFASPEPGPTAGEVFTAGDRVTHDRLGLGRVIRVVDDESVVVAFGRSGDTDRNERAVSHRKLTKL